MQKELFYRALIFTPQTIYWECRNRSWCEESHWEATDLPILHRAVPDSSLQLFRRKSIVEDNIDELKSPYREAVMQYTQRHFSFEVMF